MGAAWNVDEEKIEIHRKQSWEYERREMKVTHEIERSV